MSKTDNFSKQKSEEAIAAAYPNAENFDYFFPISKEIANLIEPLVSRTVPFNINIKAKTAYIKNFYLEINFLLNGKVTKREQNDIYFRFEEIQNSEVHKLALRTLMDLSPPSTDEGLEQRLEVVNKEVDRYYLTRAIKDNKPPMTYETVMRHVLGIEARDAECEVIEGKYFPVEVVKEHEPLTTINEKYIIVKLSDAKALVELYKDYVVFSNLLCEAKSNYKDNVVLPSKELFDRFQKETGADIIDIVNQLKGVTYCHACVIEGQEHTCNCLHVNKLGRRLSRLIDRANDV